MLSFRGRPNRTPLFWAASLPALVRSRIRSRSNSAMPAKSLMIILPAWLERPKAGVASPAWLLWPLSSCSKMCGFFLSASGQPLRGRAAGQLRAGRFSSPTMPSAIARVAISGFAFKIGARQIQEMSNLRGRSEQEVHGISSRI